MIDSNHDLQLAIVDFELDAKEVVDQINSSNKDVTKLGVMLYDCKHRCNMYILKTLMSSLDKHKRMISIIL